MGFTEKLAAAVAANRSHLCVGLDPEPALITGGDVLPWARQVIAATQDLVCCYKPNAAFYEALGPHGWETLAAVVAAIPATIPVLLDAKRGDVGNTARAYARAVFENLGVDAVTVSPYLGGDSLQPFLAYTGRAIFVLCRTSNPGAGDLQDLTVAGSGRRLYEVVAERARDWSRGGAVGLVAGATFPNEIARIRAICPEQLLLVPGVGAQGGDLQAAVRAARDSRGSGFLINSSRQITYAKGAGAGAAARAAAQRLRDTIEEARADAG